MRVAKTCPCNVNTFLLLEFEGEGVFRALAAVYTNILNLCCSKFSQKVVPNLHKPKTRCMCALLWSHTQVHLHVNGSVRAKFAWRSLVTFGRYTVIRFSSPKNFRAKNFRVKNFASRSNWTKIFLQVAC